VLEAPGKITFTPSGTPPAASSSSRSVVPIGSSHTPSRPTSPATVKHIVPGEGSVPHCRSQSGPSARMWATFDSVSTLFTAVGFSSGGLANRPQ
jgi:hypothetical protein